MTTTRDSGPSLRSLLALTVITLLICLLIVEFVLHALDLPVFTYIMGDVAYDLNRKTLYQITPNCRPDINSLGYRDREISTKTPGTERILMYGDSFTIGLNVVSEQTIPKLVEKLLGSNHEVFNMGVYGYGPDQSFLRMQDEIDSLAPDLVLLELFPANDFNDLYKDNLFDLSADGSLRYNENNLVASSLPRCRLCTMTYKALTGHYFDSVREKALAVDLFRDTYDRDLLLNPDSNASKKKVRLMIAILRNIKQFLQSRNVRFAAVIVPSLDNIQDDKDFKAQHIPAEKYFYAEDLLEDICAQEKIPLLNLKNSFAAHPGPELFEKQTGHLALAGNQYAADIIAHWIRGGIGKTD